MEVDQGQGGDRVLPGRPMSLPGYCICHNDSSVIFVVVVDVVVVDDDDRVLPGWPMSLPGNCQ